MARYEITGPEGKRYEITAPEGASEQDVLSYAKSQFGGTSSSRIDMAPPLDDPKAKPIPERPGMLSAENLAPLVEGVVEGVTDVPVNINRMVTGVLPFKGLREKQEQFVQEREKRLAEEHAKPGGVDIALGRTVGNIAATAPLGAVAPPGTIGAMMTAAVSGELGRAPPIRADTLWHNIDRVFENAGGGAAGFKAVQASAQAIAPVFNAAKNLLLREGVDLTPGQMARGGGRAGDYLSRGESAASSLPLVGSEMRAAQRRGVEGLNRAAWNRVLEPLGEKMPVGTEMGRSAARYVKERVDAAYDRIWPNVNARVDPTFMQDYDAIMTRAKAELPPDRYTQLENFMNGQASKTSRGAATGKMAKSIDSEIGAKARGYMDSEEEDVRAHGRFLQEMQTTWRDLIERQNPAYKDEIRAANSAYALGVRVMRATAARGAKGGVFSPAQLGAAVRQSDPSLRKMRTATGEALLTDLADAGELVLPSEVRDSGTPERALWAGLLLEGGSRLPPEHAMGLAAATIPYTPPGMTALNAWARPGPTRAAAARAVRSTAPAVASMAGSATQPVLRSLGVNQSDASQVSEALGQ